MLRYLAKRKDMTYILGARCRDGVVLVGDRKVTDQRGMPMGEADKIFRFGNIAFGAAGIQSLADSFMRRVSQGVNNLPMTVQDFLIIVENKYQEMVRLYDEHFVEYNLHILIAQRVYERAELYSVLGIGAPEQVSEFQAIGAGEVYDRVFFRHLWRREGMPLPTMEEVAEIGTFIIRYIERFNLDNSVGIGSGRPQILLFPDRPNMQATEPPFQIDNADDQFQERVRLKTDQRLGRIESNIRDFWTIST